MTESKPLLSDHTYNVLKKAVQITLPAAVTLYFGIAQVWDLPKTDEIMATLTGITTFLGVLLGVSTKSYNKSDVKFDGEIQAIDHAGVRTYSLVLKDEPENLDRKDSVLFKVSNEQA